MQQFRSIALVLAFLAARAQAGNVLVVAPAGAPFTDIQTAISASSDGDVILVKSGTYPGFSIGDQSLTVVEDEGQTVIVDSPIAIGPAAATRTIVLSGLRVLPPSGTPGQPASLIATSVHGILHVQGCVISSADGYDSSSAPNGSDAIVLVACDHARIAQCTLHGGQGSDGDIFLGPPPGAGGSGLRALASDVAIYDSQVYAGGGLWGTTYYDGGNGGVGLVSDSTSVFTSHATIYGGTGGTAYCCGYGGNGGDAVHRFGTSTVTVLDSVLSGGGAGLGYDCLQCGTTPPGIPGVGGGATTTLSVAGGARSLEGPAVVREQGPITLTVTGQPGDRVGLYLSFLPAQQFVPSWNGVLAVSTAPGSGWRLVRIGTIDASGSLTRTFVQPDLAAGVQAQTRWLQIRVVDSIGTNVIGTPLEVVALDSAF